MIEPIYIYRPVSLISAISIIEYALGIGIPEPAYDLHVTLAYSTEPVDWDAPAFQMNPTYLTIQAGGAERRIRRLDKGAIVLPISSPALDGRWAQFIGAGASWGFPNYDSHITLGYDPNFDVSKVDALYQDEIKFGPEEREYLRE